MGLKLFPKYYFEVLMTSSDWNSGKFYCSGVSTVEFEEVNAVYD